MTELERALSDRKEEFINHYTLAVALEQRVFNGEDISIGKITLSSRHLLNMKSGLVVHLYNIIEATMTKIMEKVGDAIGSVTPTEWSENAMKEWLRENAVSRIDGNEESKLDTVQDMSRKLLGTTPLGRQVLKKPSGTWDCQVIVKFATRLGVKLDVEMTPEVWRLIAPSAEYGDKRPLVFLGERRNAIAHGRLSFENGASDLTLVAIKELADTTMTYLEIIISAFQKYIDDNLYISAA